MGPLKVRTRLCNVSCYTEPYRIVQQAAMLSFCLPVCSCSDRIYVAWDVLGFAVQSLGQFGVLEFQGLGSNAWLGRRA